MRVARDALRARRFALAVIRATAETFGVHLRDHFFNTFLALRLALRQQTQCDTFADVNNIADAFGQAATHAPQPMHAAASNARSESCFGTRMSFASRGLPLRTET